MEKGLWFLNGIRKSYLSNKRETRDERKGMSLRESLTSRKADGNYTWKYLENGKGSKQLLVHIQEFEVGKLKGIQVKI